jgi:hypothetical protein
MSRSLSSPLSIVMFLAPFAGLALSVWRFRAGDPLGGTAASLAGMLLMVVLATRLPAE